MPLLREAQYREIRYFTGRDLHGMEIFPLQTLWEMPEVRRLLRCQQPDGSWKYPGANHKSPTSEDYSQIETFRNLGILVEKYGLTREHDSIRKAAEYFFSKQTVEGDIRGIYGSQYTPNYTGAILELLIKAGYTREEPIRRGLGWLLEMRQDDGGWSVPLRTHKGSLYTDLVDKPPVEPLRSKPSSHLATGCVLRAFAAHPDYHKHPAVQNAGSWLASRLLKTDNYPDRRGIEYWTRFSFPFWFTDLISALDSLSCLGFPPDQPDIRRGLDWFINHQLPDGTWQLKLLRDKDITLPLWMQLNICRVFHRFYRD